jgi:hypothetical protein
MRDKPGGFALRSYLFVSLVLKVAVSGNVDPIFLPGSAKLYKGGNMQRSILGHKRQEQT